MSALHFGDLATSFLLSRKSAALKGEMTELGQSLANGFVSDPAQRLGGFLSALNAVDAARARLKGYHAATTESAQNLAALQKVVGTLSSHAEDISATLVAAVGSNTPVRLDAAGAAAQRAFEAAVSAINSRFGDRSLLAGDRVGTAPLIAAGDILDHLETAVAGLTRAQDIVQAVSDWFSQPTGFDALAYQGGPGVGAISVAPDEQVSLQVTARDPALKASLRGLALGALLTRGALAPLPAERMDLARRGAADLMQSASERAHLAADIGLQEKAVEDASRRNSAEATALDLTRVQLVGVDEFAASTRLREAEGTLERVFAITARMMRLSMTEFMR